MYVDLEKKLIVQIEKTNSKTQVYTKKMLVCIMLNRYSVHIYVMCIY